MAHKSGGLLCGLLLLLLQVHGGSSLLSGEQTVSELVKHSTDAVVQIVVSDSLVRS